jgi:hypothetical protein
MAVDEQRKFLREATASGDRRRLPARRSKKVEWPDVEARASRITGERLMPNLILLECDEAAF